MAGSGSNQSYKRVNPKMVELAREARELTQTKLASLLNVSQGMVSKIEQGLNSVDDDILRKLSRVLRYPESFFLQDHRIYVPGIGFDRNRKSLGVKKRNSIDAKINIQRMHVQNLLSAVELVSENIPRIDYLDGNLSPEEPEIVANAVRQYYKLPRGPIENLTKVLEDSGIFVIETDFDTDKQFGMTVQAPEVPAIIFLNKNLSPDRMRFTLAHELGHIIMHEMPSPESESQADRFASELLLPSDEIKKDLLNHGINRMYLQNLKDLKYKWGVSFQTLVKKALDLGIISAKQRQYFYVQMSRNGYSRNNEPDCGLEKEKPTLFNNLLKLYKSELDYSDIDLAKVMSLNKEEYQSLYSNEELRPRLRLIANSGRHAV
ncbi:MAG: ImmA/IrrE family metallo-endopeptidase [Balneola sp.]|nr:MAG: ImmA/IrrE family metallo-endopeptidase [Balneola sp.]